MPIELEEQAPAKLETTVERTSEPGVGRDLSEEELRQVAGGVKPPPQTNPFILN